MKKFYFLFLVIFVTANIYSQTYTISFAVTGAATTVDSVKVENLTQGTSVKWYSGDILQLVVSTGINEIDVNEETLQVYPNPMQGQAEISFYAKQTGNVILSIYDITGKEVLQIEDKLLQGTQKYQLAGLKQGSYFIIISGNTYFYTAKLISQNATPGEAKIKYIGNEKSENVVNALKSTKVTVTMSYTTGDNLRFTGYAGNLTAIVDDVPTGSKIITFTFAASLPTITTTAASAITSTAATSGGNVTADGGAIVTARGVCYATTANPTTANNTVANGSGIGIFTANITGLTASTTYYVRAYATNSVGIAYGNQVNFTTTGGGTSGAMVTDIDGNIYDTIHIGVQIWLKQNLKVTHYCNGDSIFNVIDNTEWGTPSTGAYCDYNNTASNGIIYGKLYNWYAVADTRNLCPTDWHIPTDVEWTILTTYLGGESIAGGKLKEIGTVHWLSPNTGATNETGFTALGGGHRNYTGIFGLLGFHSYWWTSSEFSATEGIYRYMESDTIWVNEGYDNKVMGAYVRCLKN